MRKYLALVMMAIAGVAMANNGVEPVGSTIDKSVENVTPAFVNMPKDVGNIPTTFPGQPPLIPHSIRGLQITGNVNQCLGCHGLDAFKVTGAPRLPESHFKDRTGAMHENESPRRYFCLQCHVPQAEVNPIIQNKFDSIKEAQGK